MVKIIGVRFRNAGKVYYFDPKNYKIKAGDHVIVETARGVEYGTAIGGIREVGEDKVFQPLKSVLRVATPEDDARAQKNRAREREALRICNEKIRRHNLDMKLIDAEYTFDNNKVLFYFTADGRIDFRDLVKDLAAVFKMRIELRQIGVRDETKILGGIGICGRVLCCNSFLSDFAPVSIKMAKEQNLSLNPTKISGVCGRLMCCLKNEEDTYEYLNSKLPNPGDAVLTADGVKGEVHSVNVLRQKVKVLIESGDEKELREYDVKELKFKPRRRKEKGGKGERAEKGGASSKEPSERGEKGGGSAKEPGERGEKGGVSSKEPGERGERGGGSAKEAGERGEKGGASSKEPGERGEKGGASSKEPGERGEKSGGFAKESGERREKGSAGERERAEKGSAGERERRRGGAGERRERNGSSAKEQKGSEVSEKRERKG